MLPLIREKGKNLVASSEVIGILGGMGPAATADFYTKLVSSTRASTDQEHPRVVIWADPSVPDRAEALLHHGPDPMPALQHGLSVLEQAGATLVAVPCNTAHSFLPALARSTRLPIIHMIDEVARQLTLRSLAGKRVGVLATAATCRIGLYGDWLGRVSIDVVTPTEADQEDLVSSAIRRIKQGDRSSTVVDDLVTAGNHLISRGADALIAGCTELPLVLRQSMFSVELIDPTQVLVDATLARARLPRRM